MMNEILSASLAFSLTGVNHIIFKVEIMSNEDREWHESFSLVLGPDDPVEAVLGDTSTAIVTILDQEAAGSLILPAAPVVSCPFQWVWFSTLQVQTENPSGVSETKLRAAMMCQGGSVWEGLPLLPLPSASNRCCCVTSVQVVTLADYDQVEEVTKDGAKKSPSPGYPLICVTPCDPRFPKYAIMRERCSEAGINQSSIQFSWEVATPTDGNGARSPFETITDNTPFTSVNHKVCGRY